MQTKKRTLQRLTVLYVIFFAVIALSFALSLNGEFMAGWNDAQRMIEDVDENGKAEIFYDLSVIVDDADFTIPVFEDNDKTTLVMSRPSKFDAELILNQGGKLKGSGLAMFFWILSGLCYIAIFVLIFMILTSLRRSIHEGDAFARKNIVLTRVIAIMLIAGSLLKSFGSWIERRALAPYFAQFPYNLDVSFPINFPDIIMGVLIFVIAEVFVIGYSLSEEQKLTI